MDTNHNTREDQPRNINAEEIGKNEPSKVIKAQEKIEINESALGRDQGQTPADEHIESQLSQIDSDTIAIQQDNKADTVEEHTNDNTETETSKSDGNANEINDSDVRDQNDSTTDWEAENSKTGRHK